MSYCLKSMGFFIAMSMLVDANACTGIRLKTEDNNIIYGRTMEFGEPLHSKIMYVPKGFGFQGSAESGKNNGMTWTVKYPFVGASAYDLPFTIDGVNSQGLAVGIFYFPSYAKYASPSKSQREKSIGPWQLPTYLLSQYSTVEEVKKALSTIDVVSIGFKKEMPPLELHYVVHDASGKSLVIEYIDGKLVTYDNPLGVISNAPSFDWHMTNLATYDNLHPNNTLSKTVDGITLKSVGQGSGMMGLPGDFTPPSRFVRAALFTQYHVPAKSGSEGIFNAFHILNQFDIPKGSVRGKDALNNESMAYTQWTSAANLKDKKYYYHTYTQRNVGMIDLMKMDSNTKEIQFFPMDKTVHPVDGVF